MKQFKESTYEKAQEAYRELDFPKAWRLIIKSMTDNPGPQPGIGMLKHLCQVIGFSAPEGFDEAAVMALLDRNLSLPYPDPGSFSARSLVHKVARRWQAAREDAFMAVWSNRTAGDENNHHRYLFELAYLWKNQGRPDVFTPLALSIPWSILLFRSSRMTPLPRKIMEERTVTVNFDGPPVKTLRAVVALKGSFCILQSARPVKSGKKLLRHLEILHKNKVPFGLGFIPPPGTASDPALSSLDLPQGSIPATPGQCPYSAVIDNYTLTVCPLAESLVKPAQPKMQEFWQVSVAPKPQCFCGK